MNILRSSYIVRGAVHMRIGESRIPVSAENSRQVDPNSQGHPWCCEFPFILHRFSINVIGLTGLLLVLYIAWPDVRECCTSWWLLQHFTTVHTAISVSARPNGSPAAVTDRLTDLPRPVQSLHLHLLGNRFWSNTLREGQKMCPILCAAADRSVEELEVATDSEDVVCAVPIFRGQGAVCAEIQECAVGTIRREAEQ